MANVLSADEQVAIIKLPTYLEELQDVIRRLHGVESKYIESFPITETFHGRAVWEGNVEIFEPIDHPKAPKVYAWTHDVDPKKRHVTVLHMDKETSSLLAVRAAIVQEFREREPEAEA